MKTIRLVLIMAIMTWAFQAADAQTTDTAKNHIEVTKKTKTRRLGRKVTTKTVMHGTGTPGAISGAADEAVTGKPIQPAPVATPPPAPVETPPAPPTVIVVKSEPEKAPEPPTTSVTTTTETKPVPVSTTTSTRTTKTTSAHVVHHSTHVTPHTYHKVYKKTTPVASATTTTTTVKKTQSNQ
ncbi:MAG: hypothetical protein JWP45_175 [Mucilaginibacter sp.]|nr:hypothetical protein [Mucilaginibacter sp.]